MNILGSPYPIEKHPLGLFHTTESYEAIKSDLLILLLTNPGERVMMLNYGTPLRKLMFEPNDPTVVANAKQIIWNSINSWEPRISIESINITSNVNEDNLDQSAREHILGITINFFDPNDINQVEKLKLEVPMSNT